MVLFTELQQMSVIELRAALEKEERELDDSIANLTAMPLFGSPAQNNLARKLADKMESQQAVVEAMTKRLRELDPPAAAYDVMGIY